MTETPDEATVKVPLPSAKTFVAGRYAVQRVLGEGGQKLVYLVHDKTLDRDCALALIRAESLEAEELERFRREAQVMASFGGHRNIVTVFDTGEEDGRPYLISEYVPGGDLRNEVRKAGGPVAIDRAVSIGSDLADALAIAHEHGVIHRDVKPANVWLAEDGHAKLGDFGLAMAMDRSRLTMAGVMMGTAAYTPPEQALGGEIDGRSDLYSLGCVLYELVAGRPPFLGDDIIAVVSQHINTAPVAPSWHNPAIPRALDTLILRLLSKSPGERPESAGAVVRALSLISSAPLSAAEPAEQVTNPLDRLEGGLFIGRREEMGELRTSLESALSGRGRLAMIEGEAGIGKTRLIEELCTYGLLRGVRVLSGRCYEGEGAAPFWPWVQPIRQYVQESNAEDLRDDMGPGAADIAQIVPEIHERIPDLQMSPPLEPEQARFRLFDSVATFLKKASRRKPIVLVLDDLHWADKGSLLLIQFLARELGSARLLIIGAYRDVELDRTHPLSETLEALRREPVCERLVLRGLSQGDVGALMSAMGEQEAAESLVRLVYQETEGNPFFIEEILKHLIEEGKIRWDGGQWTSDSPSISQLGIPEGVRAVISRRVSRLSNECIRMLTLASAMTGGFSWNELKAISSEDEPTLLDLLDEALAAQLVHERKNPLGAGSQAGSFEFTHALIRHTLYDALSTPRRMLLHRQIGESLERLYEGRTEEHLAELAHHFSAAAPGGDIDKAVNYGRRAGDSAVALFAWEDATDLFEHAISALELQPPVDRERKCDLLLAIGDAQLGAGNMQESQAAFCRAAEVAKGLKDGERMALAALGYGRQFVVGIVQEDVAAILREALDGLSEQDSPLRARLLARLGHEMYFSSLEEFDAQTRQSVEVARRVGDKAALSEALIGRMWGGGVVDSAEERLAVANEIIGLAEATGDRHVLSAGLFQRINNLLILGDVEAAYENIETFARLASELRNAYYNWQLELFRCMRALFEGRLDEAERLAQGALAVGQRGQEVNALQTFGAQTYAIRREQGRLAEMEAGVQGFAQMYPAVPAWRTALAFNYAERGMEAEARSEFEILAKDDFSVFPRDSNWPLSMALLAQVCSSLGDAERAAYLYDELAPFEHRCIVVLGCIDCYGTTDRLLGLMAATMSRWDDAERHFTDALEMNARMGTGRWTGWTQYEYAKMLLTRDEPGDREKARVLVEEAFGVARELGMKALEERAGALKAACDS